MFSGLFWVMTSGNATLFSLCLVTVYVNSWRLVCLFKSDFEGVLCWYGWRCIFMGNLGACRGLHAHKIATVLSAICKVSQQCKQWVICQTFTSGKVLGVYWADQPFTCRSLWIHSVIWSIYRQREAQMMAKTHDPVCIRLLCAAWLSHCVFAVVSAGQLALLQVL